MNRCYGVAVLLSLLVAGCSGYNPGFNSGPPPPPPTGPYSNASLSGQYAFSMAGQEPAGTNFARIGSFTADGQGHITAGMEDLAVLGQAAELTFSASTYSIQANGRGTLNLTDSTGTSSFSIALVSAGNGYIVETDNNGTASGSFAPQTASAFSQTSINGNYVFDFSGLDASAQASSGGVAASLVGEFGANGGGGISGGVLDLNEGGTLFPNEPFTGSYALDATNGNGSTFGRATATINSPSLGTRNFAFYIVNGTDAKFLEEDTVGVTFGDAGGQSAGMPANLTALNGSFAFMIGGSSSQGPIATAGRFTADGSGNISAITLDENNSGSVDSVTSGAGTSNYNVDASGDGRGTISFNIGSVPFTFVFYLISPSSAVLQETDSGITSDGSMLAQTQNPFSNSSLAGNYAFDWSGSDGFEQDFTGEYTLASASSNNISGVLDYNELSLGVVFRNVVLSGGLALSGDGTGRNTFTATLESAPQITLGGSVYVVNDGTAFFVGTTSARVIEGVMSRPIV